MSLYFDAAPEDKMCLRRLKAGAEPPTKGWADSAPSGNLTNGTSGLSNKGFWRACMISSCFSKDLYGLDCVGTPSGVGGSDDSSLDGERAVERSGSTDFLKLVKTSGSSLGP